jgi:hypothetical protein
MRSIKNGCAVFEERPIESACPIPDLIRQILGQIIDACIAEAELPNKIVKFPARRAGSFSSIC